MATKASERQARFDEKSCTRFNIKLHNVNDKDIIDRISKAESKQGFIKEAIRAYIKAEQST